MRFREQRNDEVNIDLTPFVDVVFMLLLFFVVSTSLIKGVTQLGVQLPQANAEALAHDSNSIELGVDAKGHYYLNGEAVEGNDMIGLKKALQAKLAGDSTIPVILAGDKNAPHQAVVSALEVASHAGVNQIRIVAMHPAP
jgi:biopolymer transport protein ExbD